MIKLLLLMLSGLGYANPYINNNYPQLTHEQKLTRSEWRKLHPGVPPPLTEAEKQFFRDEGLPVPGEGVKIEPMNPNKMPKEFLAELKRKNLLEAQFGYDKKFSAQAKNLSEMIENAKKDFEETKSMQLSAHSTHLRKNADEVPLKYAYTPVPLGLVERVISFAPMGSFVEEGWNGIVEFFVPQSLSVICSYEEVSVALTGTSVLLPPETVTHAVNHKITTIDIEGNDESGILYHVEWYDNTYRHALYCVTKDYSTETKKQVIALAQEIDKK